MLHTGGWHGDEEGLQDDLSPPAGYQEELRIPPGLGTMVAAATDYFVED